MADSAKIRHEWYQSDDYVTVEVFAKQLQAQDVDIAINHQSLSINARLPSGSEYVLDIEPLNHPVNKQEKGADDDASQSTTYNSATALIIADMPPSYPTSARKTTNWDKVVRETEQDKEAGGDEVNQLFQQIYANADPDTRRAMIKSFTESGGTSLSTNWEEVGHKQVDVVPPEGMEARKYES
ncbi:SGS domain-containing protein [Syncephalis fuscata]|nr:SGS domain-containing protein [Syncephalis fuscata]